MKKCIIITSYIEGDLLQLIGNFDADLILCADGGYDHAKAAGIIPDFLIGDFDSIQSFSDPEIEKIVYPSEKDDTDTGLCLSTALEHGCKDILILGGLGGRLDHTISNIELITGKIHLADSIMIKDRHNSCVVIKDGSITLKKQENQFISVFSMTEKSYGVSEFGVKYPLDKVTLPFGSTLGTSNEYVNDTAEISVENGILLIVLSDKEQGVGK